MLFWLGARATARVGNPHGGVAMFAKLRPSPAMVVAILAPVVAPGGAAFAGPVARMASTISGSTIEPRSIPGNRMELNTLTGKEIMESSLGPVPKATSAMNASHAGTANSATNAKAVGGITARKIFYAPATNKATPTTILSLGGLTLSATCPNGIIAIRV